MNNTKKIKKEFKKIIDIQTDINFRLILMDDQSLINTPDNYIFLSTLDKALEDEHITCEIIEFKTIGYTDYIDSLNEIPYPKLSLISLCHKYKIQVEEVLEKNVNYAVFMQLSIDTYKKMRNNIKELIDQNKKMRNQLEEINKRRRKKINIAK